MENPDTRDVVINYENPGVRVFNAQSDFLRDRDLFGPPLGADDTSELRDPDFRRRTSSRINKFLYGKCPDDSSIISQVDRVSLAIRRWEEKLGIRLFSVVQEPKSSSKEPLDLGKFGYNAPPTNGYILTEKNDEHFAAVGFQPDEGGGEFLDVTSNALLGAVVPENEDPRKYLDAIMERTFERYSSQYGTSLRAPLAPMHGQRVVLLAPVTNVGLLTQFDVPHKYLDRKDLFRPLSIMGMDDGLPPKVQSYFCRFADHQKMKDLTGNK